MASKFKLSPLLSVLGFGLTFGHSAQAQVIPDDRLGASERSQVRQQVIRGLNSDRIEGGARRENNLFHSFQRLDVGAEQGVYFSNPTGVENIFGRVTGGFPSNIQGTLGVIQDGSVDSVGLANLFLINPSGILFGAGANLDVGGSFFATTADAVGFGINGTDGIFSASVPESSNLLNVAPSAFLFNSSTTRGAIISQAQGFSSFDQLSGDRLLGLQVPFSETLLLLGGDVNIQDGWLNARGGRVEIGATGGAGVVGLNTDGSLQFPQNIVRGDVSFTNASVNVSSPFGRGNPTVRGGRSAIGVTGGDINFRDSWLRSNIVPLQGIGGIEGLEELRSGGLRLDASGAVAVESSLITANTQSGVVDGNSGNIQIAAGSLQVDNGSIISSSTFGLGNSNSGNIQITVGSLQVDNGLLSADTYGQGNTGEISISSSQISSGTSPDSVGQGGNIQIDAGSLALIDRASISSSTLGIGNSGDIKISADSLEINNSSIDSTTFGQGNAGEISINSSGQILLSGDFSGISSNVGNNTNGRGGNIQIDAGSLALIDRASLNTGTGFNSVGDAGNIHITTENLEISGDSEISAGTIGQGTSGRITIDAQDQIALNNATVTSGSIVTSGADLGKDRRGGDILISSAGSISVNRSNVRTDSATQGIAGSIRIVDTTGSVSLSGSNISSLSTGGGQGGDINISSNSLVLSNNTKLDASSFQISTGSLFANSGSQIQTGSLRNVGDISINARNVFLNSGTILSQSSSTGVGGNIDLSALSIELANTSQLQANRLNISTGSLSIRSGSKLDASPVNHPGGMNGINITARDHILLDNGEISSTANSADNEQGSSDIHIVANSLTLRNRSTLNTQTAGQRQSGNITIQADSVVRLNNSNLFAQVDNGSGGNLHIFADSLSLRNRSELGTISTGQRSESAGNIAISTRDRLTLNHSALVSGALTTIRSPGSPGSRRSPFNVSGQGGLIYIDTKLFRMDNRSELNSGTFRVDNGEVIIHANERISLNESYISSGVNLVDGRGSNLNITTDSLSLAGNSSISSSSLSGRRSGDITIAVPGDISLSARSFISSGRLISGADKPGRAGNIQINAGSLDLASGSEINASTSGRGRAGNISVVVSENVSLNNSYIASVVDFFGTGQGGSIFITTDSLSLSNGSRLTTQTQALENPGGILDGFPQNNLNANAGNIAVDANKVRLSNSDITTNAQSGNGTPDISRRNGGNINLDASTIVAAADSDILAFATGGEGGDINFRTRAFISEPLYRPQPQISSSEQLRSLDNNDRSDVNASGQVSGSINGAPDVTFLENDLAALEDTLVNPDSLLANSCIARTEQNRNQEGSFIVTGSGGFPTHPSEVPVSPYPTGEVRSFSLEPPAMTSTSPAYSWHLGDPIVEPQAVHRQASERRLMSHECSSFPNN
jgi:filamentous hemagglutinin family protein